MGKSPSSLKEALPVCYLIAAGSLPATVFAMEVEDMHGD
jgi:hypothetical protein